MSGFFLERSTNAAIALRTLSLFNVIVPDFFVSLTWTALRA